MRLKIILATIVIGIFLAGSAVFAEIAAAKKKCLGLGSCSPGACAQGAIDPGVKCKCKKVQADCDCTGSINCLDSGGVVVDRVDCSGVCDPPEEETLLQIQERLEASGEPICVEE